LVPLRLRRQVVSLRRQEIGLGILRCVRVFPFISPFFFSHRATGFYSILAPRP
jgi:hypothetical protein